MGGSSLAERFSRHVRLSDAERETTGSPHPDAASSAARDRARDVRVDMPKAEEFIRCLEQLVGGDLTAKESAKSLVIDGHPHLYGAPLLDPDGTVELPAASQRVEHEVELGVVMGRRLRRADPATAAQAIWGYTIVADVTARDLQKSDKTWTRGKGFDTFCPVGPVVVSGLDVAARAIRCQVNDELRQDGSTAEMIFRPEALLS